MPPARADRVPFRCLQATALHAVEISTKIFSSALVAQVEDLGRPA
jgi:hypothetical protein